MKRKKIYVCAPYSGTLGDMLYNRKLTIERCRALYEQGCHPIAPQLFYPSFLDEFDPEQRQFGLDAGLEWLALCDEIYVYGSRTTAGMLREIDYALDHSIPACYVPE